MPPFDLGFIGADTLWESFLRIVTGLIWILLGGWALTHYLSNKSSKSPNRRSLPHPDGSQTRSETADETTDRPDTRFRDQTESLFMHEFETGESEGTNPFQTHREATLLAAAEGSAESDITYAVEIDGKRSTDEEGTLDGIPLRNAFLFMHLKADKQLPNLRQQIDTSQQEYFVIGRATLTTTGEIVIAHISETSVGTRSSEV